MKSNQDRLEKIALPGFEPGSTDPESAMIGHYTTGLCGNLFPDFDYWWNSEKYFGSFFRDLQ